MSIDDQIMPGLGRAIGVPPVKKNGGFDLNHFSPQTRKQRIASELLQLVVEDGHDIGVWLHNDKQPLNTPTDFILLLMRWSHHEIEPPPA